MADPAPPDPSAPDDRLAERIRAGDRAAFEALFRAYYPGLVGFAARLVQSRDVGEELVQDVLLKMWVRHIDLVITGSVKTYLYRAVRNQALNHIRHRKIEQQWERRQLAEQSVAPGGEGGAHEAPEAREDDAEREELVSAVRAAVAELPPRCRQVFELSRDHGLTYTEIAGVMGISIKTVETQMGRALKAIREAVKGEG